LNFARCLEYKNNRRKCQLKIIVLVGAYRPASAGENGVSFAGPTIENRF